MHVVIAQMKHETNTFSPVQTRLEHFSRGRGMPREGDQAVAAFRGTGTALGAFIDLAEQHGLTYELPIAASAWPSGFVEDDAFEYIANKICEAVQRGCDAILLDLHGAMVTRSFADAEGELLTRLRRIAPSVPIGVALDMHCNLSETMARYATSIAGYQTYPHVDMAETGIRAARPILASLGAGKTKPTMGFGFRPMLPHIMRQSSLDSPNKETQQRAGEMEADPRVLSATVFTGFPHADVACAGLSAVVVTDGDADLARRYTEELLEMAWTTRAQWVYTPEPLAASLARAAALRPDHGPVVLLDHYDNCSSGGTMDTMAVIGAVLQAGLKDVLAFAVFDPQAVAAMDAAGPGATLTMALGGKRDMPMLDLKGAPLQVSGKVIRVVDGAFRNVGKMSQGELVDMGRTALFDVNGVHIAVISKQVEPSDPACFQALGVDPMAYRYLLLKSRVHWRAGLGELAGAVVECAGVGVCTSDYAQLHFTRLGRKMYPLDLEVTP